MELPKLTNDLVNKRRLQWVWVWVCKNTSKCLQSLEKIQDDTGIFFFQNGKEYECFLLRTSFTILISVYFPVFSVTQWCLVLCDPMDCSPQGSFIHKTSQARILEWAAISFSRVSSQPRDQTHVSCSSGIGRQILYHYGTREACSQNRDAQHT